MKKHPFLLIVCSYLAGIILQGCSPIYYSPNTHNVPALREKGDKRMILAGNENRLEGQAAFSPENNMGILFSGGTFFPRDDEEGDGGKGWFLESGFGYYHPVSDHFLFDVYGIFGYGYVENHFPSTLPNNPLTTGIIESNLIRYGVQPSFGFNTRYFDAILSSRFVGLSYFNYAGNLVFQGESQTQYLADNQSAFLFEPALTLRGGYDKVKLQAQLGLSFNLRNDEFRQDEGQLTVGIIYSFGQ
ncbi:MAG: hypothetical protein R3C61_14345 [Bacteroidia bacterium]